MAATSASEVNQIANAQPMTGYHLGTLILLRNNGPLEAVEFEYNKVGGKPESERWETTLTIRLPVPPGKDVTLSPILLTGQGSRQKEARDVACKSALDCLIRSQYSFLHNNEFKQIWEKQYNGNEEQWSFIRPAWKSSELTVINTPKNFWTIGGKMPHEEGRTIEYKQYEWNPVKIREEACRNICAFLNSKGGSIFFGITDECVIQGTNVNYKQRDQFLQLLNADLHSKFDPIISIGQYIITFHQVFNTEDLPVPDLCVLQIEVSHTRKYEVYFLRDKHWLAFYRRDATVQEMMPSQIKQKLRKPILALKEAMSHA